MAPLCVQITVDALRESKLCIDGVTRVCGEPTGAVQRAVGLFPAGQCHLDRAFGFVMFLSIADQIIDPNRGLGLHVARAAAIEVAVLLDQCERIARPILPLGLNHIDMREHQTALAFGSEPCSTASRPPSLGSPSGTNTCTSASG